MRTIGNGLGMYPDLKTTDEPKKNKRLVPKILCKKKKRKITNKMGKPYMTKIFDEIWMRMLETEISGDWRR